MSTPELFQHLIQTIRLVLADSGGAHPIIVHFPIALLCIVPLFLILGMFSRESSKTWYLAGFFLLLIGTVTIYTAVETGEIASEAIAPNPASEIVEVLGMHDELAHRARSCFTIFTATFLLFIMLLPVFLEKWGRKGHLIIACVFLLAYAYNLVILLNTAHYGGKLVHEYGVQSTLYKTSNSPTTSH